MATSMKTISGNIIDAEGNGVSGATVIFVLSNGDPLASTSAAVIRKPVTKITGTGGYVSVELVANDAAFSDTLYHVSVRYDVAGREITDELGNIQVSVGGLSRLEDLLNEGVVLGRGVDTVVLEAALDTIAARDEARDFADAVDPDQIEARAVADAKARAPLGPNFMKDTRYWAGLCEGQVGVEYDVRGGLAIGDPWAMRISDGVEATLKVVELDDPEIAAITANQGQLSELFGEDLDQMKCRALIMDVTITSDDEAMFDLRQFFGDRAPFGFGGEHMQQGHAGVAILSHSGSTGMRLFANVADVDLDVGAVGAGWLKVYGASNRGYRWAEVRQNIFGKGSMRVAVLLPYCSTGDHGDVAIWAPHAGGNPYSDA